MTRVLLAQDDFSCLGLAAGQDADSQPLDFCDGLHTSVGRAESGDSLKSSESGCEADELYRPVNFIPDEVYEMIRNWELTYQKQQEATQAIDSMDAEAFNDSRSSESIFEPMRCMSVLQPPKRFYRTFWRSATRRILRLEKEAALQRAAMSSSKTSDDALEPIHRVA
jgi:hypothetical protein